MSEKKIKIGDVVFFAEKNRLAGYDAHESQDGRPSMSHWGEGKVIEIREKDVSGRRTEHRYRVHWPKRGTTLWLRNRDLIHHEEINCPSIPCWYCDKCTRLRCPGGCYASVCMKCLKEHQSRSCQTCCEEAKKRTAVRK